MCNQWGKKPMCKNKSLDLGCNNAHIHLFHSLTIDDFGGGKKNEKNGSTAAVCASRRWLSMCFLDVLLRKCRNFRCPSSLVVLCGGAGPAGPPFFLLKVRHTPSWPHSLFKKQPKWDNTPVKGLHRSLRSPLTCVGEVDRDKSMIFRCFLGSAVGAVPCLNDLHCTIVME